MNNETLQSFAQDMQNELTAKDMMRQIDTVTQKANFIAEFLKSQKVNTPGKQYHSLSRAGVSSADASYGKSES